MVGKYGNMKIRGIVSTVPDHVEDNMAYAVGEDEKTIKKQVRVTGIRQRPVCVPGQRGADLCITSAKKLIENISWKPDEISCLLFISSYASYGIPSSAFFIRRELGLSEECLIFDINLACSGFVAGLQTIGGFFEGRREGTKALLLVTDTTSESLSGKDPATRILFGDAGAAIAIEKEEDFPMVFLQKSDGTGYADLLRVDGDHEFIMDGMSVFNFAISDVVDTVQEFLEHPLVEREKISCYFIHQAQKFIVDKVGNFAQIDSDKIPVTYDRYGNTGCVSIPLTMCESSELFSENDRTRVFMCGFGGGHSWGCATVDIAGDTYFEVCRSNQIYPDGKEGIL